jgi:hypothetical protein
MKMALKLAAAAALSAGLLGATTTAASAYIVCNRDGDCWHVRDHYTYRPEFGVAVYPDSWHWRAHDRYHWREHEGRGYWRSGVWVTF